MRYRNYESITTKKVLTYVFYIVLVGWFFITVVLGYQFLVENSKITTKKGGTFVEAIFNEVSYLPYLKNDGQSIFYQSFLFDACVSANTIELSGLNSRLCSISTEDHQTYTLKLGQEKKQRSDGVDLSLDDILFTYDAIVSRNVWAIKSLTVNQEVKVTKLDDQTLQIVFPTSTTDNNYFFSYYILPKHILEHVDLNQYRTIFAANPITSSCGKIAPKTSDAQSLVFDLVKCEDTNLAFYQIKNYGGFEMLSKAVVEQNNNLIDTYANQVTLPGYEKVNVIKNQLLTLFFNTKSPKMKVRFRRAFGGLINANFYTEEYAKYLKKYSNPLLSLFLSDGSNIKEFLNRLTQPEEGESVVAEDLWDSGVSELKKSITINGVERKFVFHLAKPANNLFNLEIKFSNQFEDIKVTDANKNTFSPKNYKKTDKKIIYPLEFGKNLVNGLNQYTIQGTIKGKTYTIAYLDVYLLGESSSLQTGTGNSAMSNKVKVVYYNNLESNFAIKQMREILEKFGVLDFFLFEQISSPEELEARLILGDYDIILNTINIGMKKDILKILTTQDPLINPSKYTNPNLTQLFRQYTKSVDKNAFTQQINQQFAIDMPFVILGYPYDFVNVKSDLMGTGMLEKMSDLYEYNRRDHLLKHVVLIQNTVVDFSKLRDFPAFIRKIAEGVVQDFTVSSSGSIQTEVSGGENQVSASGTQLDTQKETEQKQLPTTYDPKDPFKGLIQPAQ